MSREDIIRMAREAGMERIVGIYKDGTRMVEVPNFDLLKRFAALVAAAERKACENLWETLRFTDEKIANHLKAAVEAEREACAQLAEQTVCDTHLPTGYKIHGTRVAKAIRERSNP